MRVRLPRFVVVVSLAVLTLVSVSACSLGSSGQAPAAAKIDFPTHEIKMVVPFAPGGGNDTQVRGLAPFLSKHLPNKVPVVLDNMQGGGGAIGYHSVWKAKPDGYTLVQIMTLAAAIDQLMLPGEIQYKVSKYEYLGAYQSDVRVWGVRPDLTWKSWQDVVNRAKEKPIVFGSGGFGSSNHLEPGIVAKELNLPNRFVHYSGTPETIAGMARKEIEVTSLGATSMMPSAKAGEVKILFVWDTKRFSLLPDVPTVLEFGLSRSDFDAMPPIVGGHRGIAAPPGTPPAVMAILRDAFVKAMADPGYHEWLNTAKQYSNPVAADVYQKMMAEKELKLAKVLPVLQEFLKK